MVAAKHAVLPDWVSFQNSQGVDVRGSLIKINRTTVVIEVYNPYSVIQLSEVLRNLSIRRGETVIYEGRAVVSNLVNTGLMFIVSATLLDSWQSLPDTQASKPWIQAEVQKFIQGWEHSHRIRPRFQLAVNNVKSFLGELNLLLEQVDAAANMSERDIGMDAEDIDILSVSLVPRVFELFQQYEEAARLVSEDELFTHKAYSQRNLHPLLMRSPFFYRAYSKPLGYAGDYRMVDMILGNQADGPTVYSKLVNKFFLNADIPLAHRNRIEILTDYLKSESKAASTKRKHVKILTVGCGPAVEIQNFIRSSADVENCEFCLVDFNDETLAYAKSQIDQALLETGRRVKVEYVNQSVHALLKSVGKSSPFADGQFDFIYCAGLFDYLSDKVCSRLISLFSKWLVLEGRLVVTNVHPDNTFTHVMEDLMEWYLLYRTADQVSALAKESAEKKTFTDETGLNVFLEVFKQAA